MTRKESLRKDMEELSKGDSSFVGEVIVGLRHADGLGFTATLSEGPESSFNVEVDEPPSRGGNGRGAPPLHYFVLGAASCLAMQFAKLIVLESLRLSLVSCGARGLFERRKGGGFTEIQYHVEISGKEPDDVVRALAAEADEFCFANNTLRPRVALTMNINYNGRTL